MAANRAAVLLMSNAAEDWRIRCTKMPASGVTHSGREGLNTFLVLFTRPAGKTIPFSFVGAQALDGAFSKMTQLQHDLLLLLDGIAQNPDGSISTAIRRWELLSFIVDIECFLFSSQGQQ